MATTDQGPISYKEQLPPIIRENYGKWEYHEFPRPGVLKHVDLLLRVVFVYLSNAVNYNSIRMQGVVRWGSSCIRSERPKK